MQKSPVKVELYIIGAEEPLIATIAEEVTLSTETNPQYSLCEMPTVETTIKIEYSKAVFNRIMDVFSGFADDECGWSEISEPPSRYWRDLINSQAKENARLETELNDSLEQLSLNEAATDNFANLKEWVDNERIMDEYLARIMDLEDIVINQKEIIKSREDLSDHVKSLREDLSTAEDFIEMLDQQGDEERACYEEKLQEMQKECDRRINKIRRSMHEMMKTPTRVNW